MNEQDIENWRKRLIFRSEHRGIKEMDIIMGRFARAHIADFDEQKLAAYEELLQENDPDLYNWIIGKEPPPSTIPLDILKQIQTQYQ